jgi:hypothetical protein
MLVGGGLKDGRLLKEAEWEYSDPKRPMGVVVWKSASGMSEEHSGYSLFTAM